MMKSVFDAYNSLWPRDRHASLKPLLASVPVLQYPADKAMIGNVAASEVIVVMREGKIGDVVGLLEQGFEHVVQEEREDFPQELLASSLMVLRPEAFARNPIPFFFTGFQAPRNDVDGERNRTIKFSQSSEKDPLLERLRDFLNENPRTSGIIDLCLQSADEMITNALFNAPVKPSGARPFMDAPRDSEVTLPFDKQATLFACYSDRRVIVGCSDLYGSMGKDALMRHFRGVFKEQTSTAREGRGGAGLGFKYLIENSANIYVVSTRGQSTLVACGFLLKGLRANMTSSKHFHFSFK